MGGRWAESRGGDGWAGGSRRVLEGWEELPVQAEYKQRKLDNAQAAQMREKRKCARAEASSKKRACAQGAAAQSERPEETGSVGVVSVSLAEKSRVAVLVRV